MHDPNAYKLRNDVTKLRYEKHARALQEKIGTFLKELLLSGYRVEFPDPDWRYTNVLTITDRDLFIGVGPQGHHYHIRWATGGNDAAIIPCEDIEEVRERIGEIVRGER